MSIKTGSINVGGSSDFDVIFVTEDYIAPVPLGPGLSIFCDVTIESFGVFLPGGADAIGKIYPIKLVEPITGRSVNIIVDGGGIIEFAGSLTLSIENQSVIVQCVAAGFYLVISDYIPGGGGGVGTLQAVLTAGNTSNLGFDITRANRRFKVDVSGTDPDVTIQRAVGKSVLLSASLLQDVRIQTWADDNGEMFLKHVDSFSVIATSLLTTTFNIPHLQLFIPEFAAITINDPTLAQQLAGYSLTWDATDLIITIPVAILWTINLEGRFFVIK